MTRSLNHRLLLGWLALTLLRGAHASVLAEWDFTRDDAGWVDEAGSVPVRGALGVCWPGSDAGLSLRSPAVEVPTRAFQSLELTAACERPGRLHLLWYGIPFGRTQPSWQGPLSWELPADSQLHDVQLLPFWQNVNVVQGVRLLATAGTRLWLQRLRISGPAAVATQQASWDLGDPLQAGQWLSLGGGARLLPQPGALQVGLVERQAVVVSPPLDLPAYQYEWLSADISAGSVRQISLQWATTGARGLHTAVLDGLAERRWYNVRVGEGRSWVGAVAGLAVELRGAGGSSAGLHAVVLGNEPQGPAYLQTRHAGPVPCHVRANQRFPFAWVIENTGGEAACDVGVELVAKGAEILASPATTRVSRMDHGVPEVLVWELQAPGPFEVTLIARHEGGELRATVGVELSAPAEPGAGGPPAAAAIRGVPLAALYREVPPAAVGPRALLRRLYDRPYLGDYEPSPEVMDCQIGWCRGHGISAWVFDVPGDAMRGGDMTALDAFLAASRREEMGFAVRWRANAPTAEAGEALFARTLAPVLAQPNYLRLAGRPLVFVAGATAGPGPQHELADLSALAGQVDLALVACVPPAATRAEELASAGYVGCADLGDAPASAAEPDIVMQWDEARRRTVPHVLSLAPAWESELTPSRLRSLAQIACLRASRPDSHALPLVVVGDWNGERGLEPRRSTGFGYLEAVREAVGLPPASQALPSDRGLAGYDRPLPQAPQAWEFDSSDSWTSAMGLSVLRIAEGQLTAKTDTANPALFGGETLLDTRSYGAVAIGLAVSAGSQGRLWWRTSLRKFTLANSLPFDLIADGAVHEYRIAAGEAPGWRGYLEGLRLDPTDVAGAAIALDYVRVLPR